MVNACGAGVTAIRQKIQGNEHADTALTLSDLGAQYYGLGEYAKAAPLLAQAADIFRELAKLNPQSAVHAKTLYTAVNVARRAAPGPVFAEVVTRPWYAHVGDAYWRFDQSHWTE